MIDLRSDTVTRPTAAMRQAMANAEVGDDVFGDDPTVRKLQDRVAELLGTEAALWTPTGTMANQIALRSHTQPGDEIIIGAGAHCWRHESGALAALGGLQTQVVGSGGTFTGADVRGAFKAPDPYSSPTRVVAVENTHNSGGGLVWERAQLAAVTEAAHGLGMRTHLDGARLWNAAVATGVALADWAAPFDTVMLCFSKGLGAPVGSILVGERATIKRARRFRKMFGGGMRQAGVLAAAALYALEHHRARLADDHARALELGAALGDVSPRARVVAVETNQVAVDTAHAPAERLVEAAAKRGVLVGAMGPHRTRAVVHLDVSDAQLAEAKRALVEAVAEVAGP
jgi:threonine aldolase